MISPGGDKNEMQSQLDDHVDNYNKMMYNYKAVVQLEDLTHERQLQERQEKLHTTTVIDTDKSTQLV